MKKLLFAIILLFTISAQAQKNILLEQSFWQTKPNAATVKAEVEKGADPAQLNQSSFDPTTMAINGDAPNETIIYLLSQPGNVVNKITHDSRTYVHWAASKGNDEILKYLIDKGFDIRVKDSRGTTPFIYAANAGQQNTKIYDLLIAKGIDVKKELSGNGANALLSGVGNDKELKLTQYFITKGLDLKSVDADGVNAFGYAARAGNIEVMKALLQKGVSVDQKAIVLASEGGRRGATPSEVFTYLESLNLKPTATNAEGRNALHNLVRRPEQAELIKKFLAAGVDVNKADVDGNTVLMNAASSNREVEVLALLLPKVKNINQANNKGVTALMMAVHNNSPEVVKYLIENGAKLDAVDADGNNLAYYLIQSYVSNDGRGNNAVKAKDFEGKFKLLKDKNYNLATAQKNGNTLYHLAVVKGDVGLIKLIQPLSVDVNAKNTEGITALHKAAMIAKDDVLLKELVSLGAKKDAKTSFDETAFDLAAENENLTKANISLTFLK